MTSTHVAALITETPSTMHVHPRSNGEDGQADRNGLVPGMKRVETEVRVIYGDTDQMGIVYHANYLRFFERGRNEFIRASGISYAEIEGEGFILPLVESNIRYKVPALFDELLTIETRVTRVTRLKVMFEYRVFKPATAELKPTDETGTRVLVAEGFTVHGSLDRNMKPKRIPPGWDVRLMGIES